MLIFDIATIAGAAAASTIAAIVWILRHQIRPRRAAPVSDEVSAASVSFLFEQESLHHVSETAAKLFELVPGRDDWTGLREKLIPRFPSFPESPLDVMPGETAIIAHEAEDTATLLLSRDGRYTRIALQEDGLDGYAQSGRMQTLQREVAALKRACDTTTHAIWQIDLDGQVIWHNAAYVDLYKRLHRSDPEEGKPVFEGQPDFDAKTFRQRLSADHSGSGQKDWYDVSAVSLGDITVYHAINVNAVVKSEVAQRNFVQTLAKTFAQLSIGLAIFDRNGQLVLFNPALIDLTDLPAEFLSSRPTLISFFDRIRENRRMPEPKNYHSWRQQITEVIAAATDGRYQETWTLETGQTYRVNGRPHPDGAIAFLIEDISAEISLTRNFRAELELGQSLMDSFDEALVVFSSSGVLTFCNLAYREMWDADPGNSFADVTIQDCVTLWCEKCQLCVDLDADEGSGWQAIIEFVLDFGEKSSLVIEADLNDGNRLSFTFSRISSGATILRCKETQPPMRVLAPADMIGTTT